MMKTAREVPQPRDLLHFSSRKEAPLPEERVQVRTGRLHESLTIWGAAPTITFINYCKRIGEKR